VVPLTGNDVAFFCAGIPAPKGSTRSFMARGRIVTKNANERTKPWQSAIGWSAAQAGLTPAGGPVSLAMTFYMPRPKGHHRANGEVKPSAPAKPDRKPDLDKLVRCVLDALTGIAYVDDSQVSDIRAHKAWAHPQSGRQPGVHVVVSS
jgi:crossover junction endodeoxyribonuclease RusA